jgi:hypothetical protein
MKPTHKQSDEHKETHIEVAPGIYQSKEDYEENMRFDEARDNELSDTM